MLSALIVNLTARRSREAVAPASPPAAPLQVLGHESRHLRLWVEESERGQRTLQLFCPSWSMPAAGRIELAVHGERLRVDYATGQDARGVMLALARALDAWFDVTLPAAGADNQRLALQLDVKHHADLTATSTDGMVLLRCDGRGVDVEVGLDGPSAAGGVVSLEMGAQRLRFTTRAGQHGAEVARQLAEALAQLGGLVELVARVCDDSYRARIELLAVRPQRQAA